MIKDFIVGADGVAAVVLDLDVGKATIRCSVEDSEALLETVRDSSFVAEVGEKYYAGGQMHPMPLRPSNTHVFDWTAKAWLDTRVLGDVKADALVLVDDLAGAARLRYITSVPGQAETYAKKEEQARTWAAAAFAGDAPSFIAAEAAALNRSAQAVAEEVIGLADFWANVKGPQIEATRRKWKVVIESSTDLSAVDACVDAARTELGAL